VDPLRGKRGGREKGTRRLTRGIGQDEEGGEYGMNHDVNMKMGDFDR
jgi:hypothetical protein